MTEKTSQPNRWRNFLLTMVGAIVAVYVLQFLLVLLFKFIVKQDDIIIALAPFQNHYLSLSPYFVTTEGMSGEFTNDITGAGRFFGGIIVPFLGFIGAFIILYFIKPIRPYLDRITQIGFMVMVFVVFYKAFFVPPKEAFFDSAKNELRVVKNNSLINSTKATLKFSEIEKIEFEFTSDYDGYALQTIVYCQLFVVINEKRFLIGENAVDSFGGRSKDWQPTEEQKTTAQKAVEALNTLLKRK